MKIRDTIPAGPGRRVTTGAGKNSRRAGRMFGAALLLPLAALGNADGPNLDRWDDWVFDAVGVRTGDQVRSGVWARLSNKVNTNQFVVYGSREYGINLVWGKTAGYNIRVWRISADPNLRTGDAVAIYLNGGGYLHYANRDYGINLVFSPTSQFEWEIRSQRNLGNGYAIKDGEPLGLYNRIRKDFVVYCEREYGINLRWLSDCDDRLRSELRVDQVSTDPSAPTVSTGVDPSPMKLQWRECNTGAPTSGHTTVVSFGNQELAKNVFKLRRNECRFQSVTVMIPYAAPDSVLLRVSVDSEHQYRENDENNNVGTKRVRIRLP